LLNFVFWILLGLNAVLFAYGRGYLGSVSGGEHEPARTRNQLAPEHIKAVDVAQARAAATGEATPDTGVPVASAEAPASTPAPAPVALVACTEAGSFGAGEARRFEARLARLALGERQSRREVQAQDVTSYLVFVPPQGSKEAAERKAAELRGLGVENFFIMSADSPYKWAISLGVFKSEASAQAMLATLGKQGVHSAKIAPRGPMATRFVYQFRDIDAATRTKIAGYADRFDAVQVTGCRL
jgi:hypothetical protein